MDIKEFGRRLKNLREELGLTQEEMAKEMADVTQSAISSYERSLHMPSIRFLFKLEETFGVNIGSLFCTNEASNEVSLKEKPGVLRFRLSGEITLPPTLDITEED